MDPSKKTDQDVESINNLDTAKMTLRWALGRLRLLESRNSALEKEVDKSQSALIAQSKTREDESTVRADRQEYYKKVEDLLADYCKGSLDLQSLLDREAGLERRDRELRERKAKFETEISERRSTLEARIKKLQEDLESQTALHNENLERILEERKKQLDKSYLNREMTLRATDHQHQVREETLADLEARNKDLYEERKQTLKYRIDGWEQERDDQLALQERQWETERNGLIAQVKRWEEQSQRYITKIQELESERAQMKEQALSRAIDTEKETDIRIETLQKEHSSKLKSLADIYEDRRKEMEASQKELRKNIESQTLDLRQEVTNAETRIQLLSDNLERSNRMIDSLRLQLEESKGVSRTLDNTIEMERALTEKWRKTAEEARMKNARLKDEFVRAQAQKDSDHAAQEDAFLQELHGKEEEIKKTWERRLQETENELLAAKKKLEEDFIEKAARLRKENDDKLAARETEHGAQIAELEKHLQDERAKSTLWLEATEDARRENALLKEAHLREDAKRNHDHNQRIQANLAEFQKKELELEQAYQDKGVADEKGYRERIFQLEAQINELHEKNKTLDLALDRRRQGSEETERRFAAADHQIEALKEGLEGEREKNNALTMRMQALGIQHATKHTDQQKLLETELVKNAERESALVAQFHRNEELEKRLQESRQRIQLFEEAAVHEKERAEAFKSNTDAVRDELRGAYRFKENELRSAHAARTAELDEKIAVYSKKIEAGELARTAAEHEAAETRKLLESAQERLNSLEKAQDNHLEHESSLRRTVVELTRKVQDGEVSVTDLKGKAQDALRHLEETKTRESSLLREREALLTKNAAVIAALQLKINESERLLTARDLKGKDDYEQQILAREDKVAALEKTNEGLSRRLAASEERAQRSLAEQKEREALLTQNEAVIAALELKINETERRLTADALKGKDDYEQKLLAREEKVAALEKTNEGLSRRLAASEERAQRSLAEQKEREALRDDLQSRAEQLDQELLAAKEEIGAYEQKNKGLEKRIVAYQERVAGIESALETHAKERLTDGTQPAPVDAESLGKVGSFIRGLQEKDRALEAAWLERCRELEEAYETRRTEDASEREMTVREIQSELASEKNNAKALAAALDRTQKEIEDLQHKHALSLKKLKEQNEDQSKRLKGSLTAEAEARLSVIQKRLDQSERERKIHTEDLEEQRQKIEELAAIAQDAERRSENIEEILRQERVESKKGLEEAAAQRDALAQKNRDHEKQQLEEFSLRSADLRKERDRVREELNRRDEALTEFKAKLEETEKQDAILRERMANLEEALSRTRQELETARTSSDAQLDRMREERESQDKALMEEREKLVNIGKQYALLRERAEHLEESLGLTRMDLETAQTTGEAERDQILKERLEDAQKLRSEHAAKMAELQKQHEAALRDLQTREESLAIETRKTVELAKHNEETLKHAAVLEERLAGMTEALSREHERAENLRNAGDEASQNARRSRLELEEKLMEKYGVRISQLQEELEAAHTEILNREEETQQAAKLQARAEQLEEALKAEQAKRVAQTETLTAEYQTRLTDLQKKLDNVEGDKRKAAELERRIRSAQEHIAALEESLVRERAIAEEARSAAQQALSGRSELEAKHLLRESGLQEELRKKSTERLEILAKQERDLEEKKEQLFIRQETFHAEKAEFERLSKGLASRWEEKRRALAILKEKMLRDVAIVLEKERAKKKDAGT